MAIHKKTLQYLKWQREANTLNETYRQMYERLYGDCHWMTTTQNGGAWLDTIMGDYLIENNKIIYAKDEIKKYLTIHK